MPPQALPALQGLWLLTCCSVRRAWKDDAFEDLRISISGDAALEVMAATLTKVSAPGCSADRPGRFGVTKSEPADVVVITAIANAERTLDTIVNAWFNSSFTLGDRVTICMLALGLVVDLQVCSTC